MSLLITRKYRNASKQTLTLTLTTMLPRRGTIQLTLTLTLTLRNTSQHTWYLELIIIGPVISPETHTVPGILQVV